MGTQGEQLPGLSIWDAAAALGVSVNTVRRRVKSGLLRSEKVSTPSGYAYRVHLAGPTQSGTQQVGTHAEGRLPSRVPTDSAPLLEALHLVNKLTQQNLELAGRVGFLQAELRQRDARILALQAPKEEPATVAPTPAPEAPPGPAQRAWWAFWK